MWSGCLCKIEIVSTRLCSALFAGNTLLFFGGYVKALIPEYRWQPCMHMKVPFPTLKCVESTYVTIQHITYLTLWLDNQKNNRTLDDRCFCQNKIWVSLFLLGHRTEMLFADHIHSNLTGNLYPSMLYMQHNYVGLHQVIYLWFESGLDSCM